MTIRRLLLGFLLALAIPGRPALAQADPVLDVAERHVRLQTQGLPGKVTITLGSLDPRTKLPPCTAHEAYTPPGARLLGKTHVGVRCLGPNVWNVLVPVQIRVSGSYVTTARPLVAGQVIQAGDLLVLEGDLENQPTGILTEASRAIGKTLRNSLGAGQPLRADQLLAPLVIRQGQTVRLISRGAGFAVTSEGRAINNAAEGQVAQIRMPSGQVVNGIATADGNAEVNF